MSITIRVSGIPKPGGSKRAFYIKKLGRAIITDACKKSGAWKDTVSFFARQQYQGTAAEGPLAVRVTFIMPRPKGHYGTGKNALVLKPTAPTFHTSKPDATKLWRSTEDALTGLLWRDDSQIAQQQIEKVYGDDSGVTVTVSMIGDCRSCRIKENEAMKTCKDCGGTHPYPSGTDNTIECLTRQLASFPRTRDGRLIRLGMSVYVRGSDLGGEFNIADDSGKPFLSATVAGIAANHVWVQFGSPLSDQWAWNTTDVFAEEPTCNP